MPSPTRPAPQMMTFPQAIQAIIDGKKVTKLEWDNADFYGVLRDSRLKLHKPDGQFYEWIVNDGDLLGKDWVVLPDGPVL